MTDDMSSLTVATHTPLTRDEARADMQQHPAERLSLKRTLRDIPRGAIIGAAASLSVVAIFAITVVTHLNNG